MLWSCVATDSLLHIQESKLGVFKLNTKVGVEALQVNHEIAKIERPQVFMDNFVNRLFQKAHMGRQ